MKRFLTILCAVALIVFAAQAQAGKSMYGGVKAGANFAELSGSDADQYAPNKSMRTGFEGGLFAGTHINENIGFRIEALYVQKGAKYDQTISNTKYSATGKLDYIEFPLLFVYDFPGSDKMGFNAFAGPTLGFNVTAKADVNGTTTDIKDNIESFEFGGAIGAGVAKKLAGGKAVTLDARYSMGGTSIVKDQNGQSFSVKNWGIGVMLGFQVPLGSQSK